MKAEFDRDAEISILKQTKEANGQDILKLKLM